jgi:HK97 family phage major capsid protein
MDIMPNIASALKEEISRLARKELRANTESLKKAVVAQRAQIAGLKKRIDLLERQARKAQKARSAAPDEEGETEGRHRWRANGFAQHRKRLGLSAAEAGKLLGVSGLTIYKWEGGQVRPRAVHLSAISQFRSMGKREAQRRLSEQ